MTRARLARYGWWQLRDFIVEKSISTIIVIALTAYLNFAPVIVQYGRPDPRKPYDLFMGAFSRTLVTLVLVAALFAMSGIIAEDRKQGYFRFLFAKPVSVRRFYAQKFVVHVIGFLLLTLLLLLVHAAAVAPIFPLAMVPVLVMLFVGVAGIGFLASALWRFDWATMSGVLFGAAVLWGMWGTAAGWRWWVPRLLPPVHRLADVVGAAAAGTAMPWRDLYWITGYGVVCFLLALILLRRRPLAGA